MEEIIIFTDGSSRGNPGPGGWGSVVVFPGAGSRVDVAELGGGEKQTTNNRMEIMAALKALQYFDGFYSSFDDKIFTIYTDSSYLLKGATMWLSGWKKKDWRTSVKKDGIFEEVKNQDLWQELDIALKGKNINWKLLKGHAGLPGNERCDQIATAFADAVVGATPKKGAIDTSKLYIGALSAYPVEDILNVVVDPVAAAKAKSKSSKKNAGPGFSYISKIDGAIQVHKTWAECEARVKGKSGARFKKAMSEKDQADIVLEFSKI